VSVSNPDYRKYVGKRVSEMIADKKKRGWTCYSTRSSITAGQFRRSIIHKEEDMQYALKQPFVSIGTDGSAMKAERDRAVTRIRDHSALRPIDGILRAGSKGSHSGGRSPQGELGERRKGGSTTRRPQAGMWADVTVFDPETIATKRPMRTRISMPGIH